MSDHEFSLGDAFSKAAQSQWQERIQKDLKGASFEKRLVSQTEDGIDIQPVYDARTGQPTIAYPGTGEGRRGASASGNSQTGWDIRVRHQIGDERLANRAMLEDLSGGASSLFLTAPPTDDGKDQGSSNASRWQAVDFDLLFSNIHLDMIQLAFAPGAGVLPQALELLAHARRRRLNPFTIRASFNADPLGEWASSGQLPTSLAHCFDQMALLVAYCLHQAPGCTVAGVDTQPHHWAGATPVQECAIAAATGVAYLRALCDRGVSLAAAAHHISFHFALDSHFFANIAKLRAFRVIWSRVLEACGLPDSARPIHLQVCSSPRSLTQFDPWVNLLRGTATCFAGALGGADSIMVAAYDAALGIPTDLGRRYARNTQLLLTEESHLADVIDPAGGSWFIESLTDELAEKGWREFQEIESQGGMAAYLRQGKLAAALDKSQRRRSDRAATRKLPITGISEYPNLEETLPPAGSPSEHRVERAPKITLPSLPELSGDTLEAQAQFWFSQALELREQTAGPVTLEIAPCSRSNWAGPNSPPLPRLADAAPFEHLRHASNRFSAAHGRRPSVFLANLGKPKHYLARTTFAKNFFEAGGIKALDQGGFHDPSTCAQAFTDSGCRMAVLCSNDKTYASEAQAVAQALKQAGAQTLFLAGRAGEHETAFRQAGIDHFIHIGCNLIHILTECAKKEGMLA